MHNIEEFNYFETPYPRSRQCQCYVLHWVHGVEWSMTLVSTLQQNAWMISVIRIYNIYKYILIAPRYTQVYNCELKRGL